MREKLGLCEWFHHNDHARLTASVARMHELQVRQLRTGISWADSHRPDGWAWLDELTDRLRGFEVLASFNFTPPSIAENGHINGPPRRLEDFADFIEQTVERFGDRFGWVELWNEPNGRYYWDFLHSDPGWHKFGEMIRLAAARCRSIGKPCVLGGLAPADPSFITLLHQRGCLEEVDAVSVHGFPSMWCSGNPDEPVLETAGGSEQRPGWDDPFRWRGWPQRIADFEAVAGGRPVWITETGLSTWDDAAGVPARHGAQVAALRSAAEAPADRVYWIGLQDLHPAREAIEGDHVDEHEYHLGLITSSGEAKPALAEFCRLMGAGADVEAV